MSCKHEDTQAGCVACEFEPFVKNNYFTGKMMGASEFIAETHFHQEKLRMHQVRLHGWGVVCGLNVLPHPNVDCRKRYVRIEAGSALDCCGHDILVPEEEMLDLLCYPAVANLAKENPARLHALGVCVRFVECATENVPVLYDDCGCDDDGCAPNRILESYAFDVQVDPPLAFLPRLLAADLAAAVFVRAADPTLPASTPRFGLAPLVGSTVYSLDAGHPKQLLAFDLSTRHATTQSLGAAAFALAGRAGFLFAATAPTGGTTDVIQVFQPGASGVLTSVDVTGTTSTDTLVLGVSTDSSRAAVVYVPESGALLAFAEDTTNGLASSSTSLGSIAANLTSFVVKPDGTTAYAIDEAASKVKAITLAAASSVTDLIGLPATAKPSSLIYIETSGKTWLAVASRIDKALYIIDLAGNALLATLALEHPPEFLAAGAQGVVYAVEEEGGADYLQAIDLAPLAVNQSAVIGGARMLSGAGLRVVALENDTSTGILASSEQLEIACDELLWHQHCTACDTANCVTLATIERYQAGATVLAADATATLADDIAQKRARIDAREGRKVLASTETLQAWLECLQLKGGIAGPAGKDGKPGQDGQDGAPGQNGKPGKDGIGFYPNLPKILDIGWRFEETRNLTQFATQYIQLQTKLAATNTKKLVTELIKNGTPPPLTLYFNKKMQGITRRTLSVRIEAPFAARDLTGQYNTAGAYMPLDLRIYGDIIDVAGPVPTPHTGENAAYAVSFVPSMAFFMTVDQNNNQQMAWPFLLLYMLTYLDRVAHVDLPQVCVDLKGEFVWSPDAGGQYTELGVLDAENIGGRVGEPPPAHRIPPIQGGKNPSGDLAQGGLFQSWFFLTTGDEQSGPLDDTIAANPMFGTHAAMPFGLTQIPATANFSSADQIVASAGVSAALAQRIVEERQSKPFANAADLRTRLKLTDRDWNKLSSKLVIL